MRAWQAADKKTKEGAEEAKRKQSEELARKRADNIRTKEMERSEKAKAKAGQPRPEASKYSKKDVLDLKRVFDEYDGARDATAGWPLHSGPCADLFVQRCMHTRPTRP